VVEKESETSEDSERLCMVGVHTTLEGAIEQAQDVVRDFYEALDHKKTLQTLYNAIPDGTCVLERKSRGLCRGI